MYTLNMGGLVKIRPIHNRSTLMIYQHIGRSTVEVTKINQPQIRNGRKRIGGGGGGWSLGGRGLAGVTVLRGSIIF